MLSVIKKVIEYKLFPKNYILYDPDDCGGEKVSCSDAIVTVYRADHNNEQKAIGFDDIINVPLNKLKDEINNYKGYIACKMENGHRKRANYLKGEDMIVLDVDNGCSILQARNMFKKFTHAVITTRSHGIKDGDRFRIYIPLSKPMPSDEEERASIVERFFKMAGIVIDKSTKDSSRFFYATLYDAKEYLNDGVLFDYSKLLDAESVNLNVAKPTPTPLPNQEFEYKKLFGRDVKVIKGGGEDVYSGELDE